ncbi:MAG: P27 family phage terminase small subunit [Clostridiales bacterium]|nr:P27 family phage terminase small subunit [Clostridiales bacterium]
MPTKSNNTGGQGGARPGAGRKKKALSEKLETGNPGGRTLKVLDVPDLEGVEMPEPHDFLSATQRDGGKLQAAEIYEETWNWLKSIGCTSVVSPQMLERYAMCAARWIQCEEMTSQLGFLSKHPTTGKPIPSPFVNIGINYMNQATRLWNEIYQIVKENCSTEYSGAAPQADLMERLLRARKGQSGT